MSSHIDIFMDEQASPLVNTRSGVATGTFETITLGDLTIFVSGGDTEAVDFWDRLRRACIEAGYRAQVRLNTASETDGRRPSEADWGALSTLPEPLP